MASGKFASSVCKAAGSGYYRYIEVVWKSTNDTAENKSTITWNAYSRSPDSSTTNWVYAKNIIVTINGTATTVVGDTAQKTYKDGELGNGKITVNHEKNGKKSVDVSITAQFFVYGTTNSSYIGSIKMSPNPVYTLSVSAETGSNITVNRTACAGSGGTGKLSAGKNKLYYGDKLKITFTPSSNYAIDSHKVNDATFTSGNTHTVSGNVTVAATATPLKSVIGATDANIESASAITVTRYNKSYTHTIKYKLGDATGTIATKSTNTSISWTVPSSFYAQIPDAKTGTCTLTCETFNGNTSLGSSTCKITVTAPSDKCKPTVTATVKDTNTITKALTGNDSTLIRYKSTALCTLKATPKNSATISSMSIAGSDVDGTTSDGVTTATKSFSSVSSTSFKFVADDSRGYRTEVTKTPRMIAYIKLSCNPVLSRPTPTGSSIEMTFTGDIFRGSFGKCQNTLTLQYRYKESGGSYGSWQTVASTNIVIGTATYRSESAISVGDKFDYNKDYVFEVRATDGGTVSGTAYTLSTVKKTITVKRGIPVFDWGESDFKFNVPVKMPDDVYYDITNKTGGGLQMNNSDISGCNAIIFKDVSNNGNEGINFIRANKNWDILRCCDGNLNIIPNFPTNETSYGITWKVGDSITLNYAIAISGFISSSSKGMYITIPLNKSCPGCTGITLSGKMTMRGVKGYIRNTTTDSYTIDFSKPNGFSYVASYIDGVGVYISLDFTEALTNATNNTPVCCAYSDGLTITFS